MVDPLADGLPLSASIGILSLDVADPNDGDVTMVGNKPCFVKGFNNPQSLTDGPAPLEGSNDPQAYNMMVDAQAGEGFTDPNTIQVLPSAILEGEGTIPEGRSLSSLSNLWYICIVVVELFCILLVAWQEVASLWFIKDLLRLL